MSDESLEWDLKVDADTQGGTKMDQVLLGLDTTIKALNLHMEKAAHATEKAGEGHKKHAAHAHGLIGVLERLVHAGLEPMLHKWKEIAEFQFISEMTHHLIELPGHMAHEIKHLGEEMLLAAAHEERMGIAFHNALGSEDAEKLEHYIQRIREHTEFTKNSLEGMGLALAKSGFRGEALGKGMEAAIDLASMSTNPEEGASAAIGALQRVMTTGRLDARALRPFGITEKQFFSELASETGLGIEAVKKRMDAGKLDIDTTLNSLYTVITKKTGKNLGGAGADLEDTFGARLKNLKEIPDLIFEKLSKTQGFKATSDWLAKIGQQFNAEGELGKRLFEALEGAVNKFANALQDIDLDDLGDDLVMVVDAIGSVVAGIVEMIGMLVSAVRTTKEAYYAVKSLAPGETGREGERQLAKMFADDVERDRQAATKALKETKEYKEDLADLEEAMSSGDLGPEALARSLKGGAKHMEEAGHHAGKAVEHGARKALKTHSPSLVFQDIGADVAEGFSMGIAEGAADVERVMGRMAAPAVIAGSGPGGAGGAPVIQITLQQQNHIETTRDPEEIPDAIAERINEIVPGALQSALEQAAMQTGSGT